MFQVNRLHCLLFHDVAELVLSYCHYHPCQVANATSLLCQLQQGTKEILAQRQKLRRSIMTFQKCLLPEFTVEIQTSAIKKLRCSWQLMFIRLANLELLCIVGEGTVPNCFLAITTILQFQLTSWWCILAYTITVVVFKFGRAVSQDASPLEPF